jgi:DNA-binding transcriptional LysR family regulator
LSHKGTGSPGATAKASFTMDMIDLRYLAAAPEAGNFAKAANALSRDESSISRRIAHLEEERTTLPRVQIKQQLSITTGPLSHSRHRHICLVQSEHLGWR